MAGERIPLEGMLNTRDLGGYRTGENAVIKKKRVIRSGGLFEATKKDLQVLQEEYALKQVVDFRTATERGQKPDPQMAGVKYVVDEILHEAQMGITHENENRPTELVEAMILMCREVGEAGSQYLGRLYPKLVTDDNCIRGYRRFFELLLEQKEGALLYHCSEGKDRVGTGTALFLSALGVEREVLLEDYLLTNCYTEERRMQVCELIRKRVPKEPEIAEHFLILNSVHQSYLESVFETIDRLYGSMDRFLREQMGLNEKRLSSLRDNYLE